MNVETIIKNEIAKRGFLSMHDFMQIALYHPEHGYYIKQLPLGAKGDFITAPEISQLFGESIALYFLSIIEQNFKGQKLNLVEIGAGKGTLMSDILRVFTKFPAMISDLEIFIIEVNHTLKKSQENLLKQYPHKITWVDSLDAIPANPTIIYANELFDCFPVHQLVYKDKKWQQQGFMLEGGQIKQTTQNNDILTKSILPQAFSKASEGDVYEYSPMVESEAGKIFDHIKKHKGIFLTLDYGYFASSLKDTVQSIYRHKFNQLTENIGNADITAYVDFGLLNKVAREKNLKNITLSNQRDFLKYCGIEQRAQKLSENKEIALKNQIYADLHRLIGETQMGNNFKVLALIEI